jgi:hypothetical protein
VNQIDALTMMMLIAGFGASPNAECEGRRKAPPSRGSGRSGANVKYLGQPGNGISGCGQCICLCPELPGREVGDWRPSAHVLWVTPKLLKSERSIRPDEYIDAAVDCRRRGTGQNRPGRIQTR